MEISHVSILTLPYDVIGIIASMLDMKSWNAFVLTHRRIRDDCYAGATCNLNDRVAIRATVWRSANVYEDERVVWRNIDRTAAFMLTPVRACIVDLSLCKKYGITNLPFPAKDIRYIRERGKDESVERVLEGYECDELPIVNGLTLGQRSVFGLTSVGLGGLHLHTLDLTYWTGELLPNCVFTNTSFKKLVMMHMPNLVRIDEDFLHRSCVEELIIKNIPRLHTFGISNADSLISAHVYLNIVGIKSIETDATYSRTCVSYIAKNCEYLQTLVVRLPMARSLKFVVSSCPRITSIDAYLPKVSQLVSYVNGLTWLDNITIDLPSLANIKFALLSNAGVIESVNLRFPPRLSSKKTVLPWIIQKQTYGRPYPSNFWSTKSVYNIAVIDGTPSIPINKYINMPFNVKSMNVSYS